jgi:hypothetical protein
MFYAACELFASSLIFMKTGKSGTLIYSEHSNVHEGLLFGADSWSRAESRPNQGCKPIATQ